MDRELLIEKTAAIERHLARVAAHLPATADQLQPATAASDAIVLHLWQAVQITIDLAIGACIQLNLGTPANYGDAFRRLGESGHIDPLLARQLAGAAGFRNVVAHAYEKLDMARVFRGASEGPAHLRAFVSALAKVL